MSTPFDTLPILVPDSPDEDPISNSGRWTFITGSPLRRTAGYTTTQPGGARGEMLWNAAFAVNMAIAVIYNNNPAFGEFIGIKLRATADASTYYQGYVDTGVGNWAIIKDTGGGPSTLDFTSSPPTLLAYDRLGFAVTATSLGLWYQQRTAVGVSAPLNTGWTEIVSATDSDIAGPGYFGLEMAGIEAELYGASGGALFQVGGPGGPGTYGPGSPTFNVAIRTGSTKGTRT